MPKKSTWIPYAVAAAAAAIVVLMAWVNRDRLNPVVPGSQAPGFTVLDSEGTERSFQDYRGKVVLVNIWATWCGPCKEEMPSMQRLWQAIASEDFEILAVSVDAPFGQRDAFGRAGGDLWSFADSLGLTFPVLHDAEGTLQSTYQTTGVPESFLVGRDGIIKRKIAGATAWDAAQNIQIIQRLLGG